MLLIVSSILSMVKKPAPQWKYLKSFPDLLEIGISIAEWTTESRLVTLGIENNNLDFVEVGFKYLNKLGLAVPYLLKEFFVGQAETICLAAHSVAIAMEHVRLSAAMITRSVFH